MFLFLIFLPAFIFSMSPPNNLVESSSTNLEISNSNLISNKEDSLTNDYSYIYSYSDMKKIPKADISIISPRTNLAPQKLDELSEEELKQNALAMTYIISGSFDKLRALLKNDLNPNIRDLGDTTNGATALMIAVANKRLNITKLLLNYGADPNLEANHMGIFGITALIIASYSGPYDLVLSLLQSGANPNYQTKGSACGYSALAAAISGDQTQITELLIESGANVNITMRSGEISQITPLMIASQKGNAQIVQNLLDISADNINVRDSEGKTALDYAYLEGNIEVVQILITNGANSFFTADQLRDMLHSRFK